ncbi:hypothetical protein M8494_29240 [Serratia ureilytica]
MRGESGANRDAVRREGLHAAARRFELELYAWISGCTAKATGEYQKIIDKWLAVKK